MPIYKVDVGFDHRSGLPADEFHNTFTIDAEGPMITNENTLEIAGPLHNFYDVAIAPVAKRLTQYLADSINRPAGMSFKFYDVTQHLNGSPHGSPVAEDWGAIDGPPLSVTPIPEECGLRLTMHGEGWFDAPVEVGDNEGFGPPDADLAPDRPQQRLTGGVMLGPFNAAAVEVDAGFKCRPANDLRVCVQNSYLRLVEELWAFGHRLCVWSRKSTGTASVEGGYVDNAWDTMRKRGPAPTIRLNASVPGGAH